MSITRSSPVQVAAYSTTYSQAPKLVSTSWSKVSVGPSHVLALKSNNTLYAWGFNDKGQLGDGTSISRSSPVQIGNPSYTWNDISAGVNFSVGLRGDNLLFTWGLNSVGQLGDLNAGTTNRSSPIQIGTSSWTAISAGGSHVVAIRSDKQLFVWGLNSVGQLGLYDYLTRSSPVQVSTSSWLSVSAGNTHTTAITSDYRLFTWGDNTVGTLGYNTPVQTTYSWTSVAGNADYTVAIRNDGLLFAWGTNNFGQLGDNSTINRSSPVQIGTSSWTLVSANAPTGGGPVLAIRNDGTLWGWGYNVTGVLGLGDTAYRSNPVQVVGGGSWIAVAASKSHAIAIKSDYTLYTWGLGTSGQLGDGLVSRSSPVKVGTSSWTKVSAGDLYSYAIRIDGGLFAWGANTNGQQGDSTIATTVLRSAPTQIGLNSWTNVFAYGATWVHAIDSNNKLFGWGLGTTGQLGYNDIISRSSPVQISSGNFSTLGAYGTTPNTLAIQTDGSLWAWGSKTNLLLGEFSNASFTYSWSQVSAGPSHTAAIRSDGRLYTWGNNSAGQIGNNTTVNTSSPTLITTTPGGAGEYWNRVSVNGLRTVAIRNDGTLWVWGSNAGYLLGDGTSTNRSAPVQITSVSSSWSQISAGLSHTAAITNTGAMYAWGDNTYTQLGYTNANSYSTLFSGSSYITIASNALFTIGTSDFTFEVWIYPTALPASQAMLLSPWNNGNGWQIFLDSTGKIFWQISTSDNNNANNTATVSLNVWTHVAWTRTGGFCYTFLNGIQVTNNANSSNNTSNGTIYIGSQGASLYFTGSMSNMRFIKGGTALYSSNFVPSKTPLTSLVNTSLLTLQNTTLIDNSGNNLTLTATGTVTAGQILNPFGWYPTQIGTSSWSQVSSYGNHSLAIDTNNKLYGWGENTVGQVGISSYPYSWVAVYGTGSVFFAKKHDGTLWGWGVNTTIGLLGVNDNNDRSSPVQIGTSSWSMVSVGSSHVLAIKGDGTLWSWGYNGQGELGNFSPTVVGGYRSSPVQIGTSSYTYVNAGGLTSFAIDIQGRLFAWGYGNMGRLGLGDTFNRSSPVQIGSSSWISVATDYGSYGYTIAVTSDYKLFTWGNNTGGYLGVSDTVHRSSPVQLGTNSWNGVVCATGRASYAVRSDNTLWGWGDEANYGALGLSSTVNKYSSPVQLASGMLVSKIIATIDTTWILRTDGALFGWGYNNVGQLGQSDTVNRSSPVQIGSYSFTSVAANSTAAVGIMYENKPLPNLFAWGATPLNGQSVNTSSPAQISTSLAQTVSSPTQIGTSSWTSISAGLSNSFAIRSDYKLYSWGDNSQLQSGYITPATALGTASNTNNNAQSYVRSTDNALIIWGSNASGEIGDSTTVNRSSPVQLGLGFGNSQFKKIARAKVATLGYTLGIKTDGTLWSWGNNAGGQLGISLTTNRSSPVQVGTLTNWSDVAAGPSHALAIKSDGSLWGWGLNTSGQAGVLSWAKVSSGSSHTLALRSDGQLYGWGSNTVGQIGDSSTANRSSPVQLGTGFSWNNIAAGINTSAAIRGDSLLFTWGNNANGALGLGDTANRSSPVQVGLSNWSQISTRDYMAGITYDNRLFTWGTNSGYQLGDGTTNLRSSPVQVGTSSYTSVTAGGSFMAAIRIDSGLFIWGTNTNGQLGLNDVALRSQPTQIGSSSWSVISASNNAHTLAVTTDGKLYSWGNNLFSQLGLNDTVNRSSPVQVGSSSWTNVFAGTNYSMALRTDNTIWAWGEGTKGNLGIVNPLSWINISNGIGIHNDYTLWNWGDNSSGQLGISSTQYRSSPVQIGTTSWTSTSKSISSTFAIKSDGSLWSWGLNSNGELGLSDTINRSSPVQIGTSSWTSISAGDSGYVIGIISNGLLFSWGNNSSYQLGLGDSINRSSPVQIGTSSWSVISAGGSHAMAIDTTGAMYGWGNNTSGIVTTPTLLSFIMVSGANTALLSNNTLWVWGDNLYGALGISTTTSRSNPVQIAGNWSYVASGNDNSRFYASAGIKTDGTLWYWGSGDYGTGNNNTVSRSSPVQVGTDSDWSKVFIGLASTTEISVFAIKSNSTLYAWGTNNQGQLGLNDVINRSSPVQIPGSWFFVATKTGSTYGINTDRLLFAWGLNSFGQLGDNTTVAKSSPIQIGTSSWTTVTAGVSAAGAIDASNRLFTWGYNPNGEIGLNDRITRSSPTQVGTSNWAAVTAAGAGGYAAIRTGGSLFGWGGANVTGQGDAITRSSPLQIGTSSWSMISSGYVMFNGVSANRVFVYGNNASFGGQGDGTTVAKLTPTLTSNLTNPTDTYLPSPTKIGSSSWTQVSAGDSHIMALRYLDGGLFTWGLNNNGQLGSGVTTPRSSPVQVGSTSWSQISAGISTGAAITTLGGLFTWGLGSSGQLGSLATTSRSAPVQVGASSWTSVRAGKDIMFGVTTSNQLFAWGANALGQLGLGDTALRSSPVQVGTNYQTMFSNPVQINSSSITNSYSTYFSGTELVIAQNNAALQFGTGDFTFECWMHCVGTTRYQLLYHHGVDVTWGGGLVIGTENGPVIGMWFGNVLVISTTLIRNVWQHLAVSRIGNVHTMYINGVSAGTYTAANNYTPATNVGIGDQASSTTPTYPWFGYISNLRVIKGQGIYTGNFTPTTAPLTTSTVGATGSGVVSSLTGTVSLLTLQDSSIKDNSSNNFPLTFYGLPLMLGPSYTQVSAGESHTNLISTNGILFNTGDATSGLLGDSTTVGKSFALPVATPTLYDNRSSPAQIGTGSWSQIAAGLNYSVALKSDGTLYTWGDNTVGYLGNGTTFVKRSMIQVGTSSYISISSGGSHTVALKPDLTLYAWGLNNAGQLGDNSVINRSSPVQVDTGLVTSWNFISAGASHSMGIDATYNLPYGWGLNSSGQLGDSTLVSKSAPVAVSLTSASNYSYQFNGTTQYLSIANSTALQFGTGAFTIECWFYNNQTLGGVDTIISKRGTTTSDDWSLRKLQTNYISFVDASGTVLTSSSVIQLNTWNHVAVTRDASNNFYMYINGTLSATGTSTKDYNNTRSVFIGGVNGSGGTINFWNGYISNVRLIKGTALYTTGFYPSTGALTTTSQGATASQVSLLTAQSATIVDNSTNAFTITNTGTVAASSSNPFGPYYSGRFNGTNQSLSIASNPAFVFGTDDFTVECWFYWNGTIPADTNQYTLISNIVSGDNTTWQVTWYNSTLRWSHWSGADTIVVPTALVGNTWYHIAVTRQSGAGTMWLNGVSIGTNASLTGNYTTQSVLKIGYTGLANSYWNGYISNVRLVKGTAVYTGNFTVPTNILRTTQSAMTNIIALTGTETVLLTLQNATIIDNSINAFTITNNNSVSITTAVAPFTASSATGSYSNWDSIVAGFTSTMGTSNNTLFTWGAGTNGQLGDNTTVTKSAPASTGVGSIWSVQEKLFSSPVQVGTAKSWSIVSAGGAHTIATATDNTVWSWGQNTIGQLGDSTTVGKSSPTQIAGNTSSYTFVTAGVSNTFAIRSTTNLLFAWGQNNAGQLGDASTVAGRSSPVQVFAGTMTSPLIPIRLNTVSGSSYTLVQAGSAASAIDSSGRLFTWGTNTAGQVADNTVVSRSSPVQVGGLQFAYINSPVQVGTSSYSQVSAGYSHTLAIDTNSLLYAWGKTPANGQSVNRSSPVQIGTNSWLNVSTGNDLSLATDITQTLYAWGLNTNYQLGSPNFYLNQTVTSPVAIGTLALRQGETSSGGAGNGSFIKNI